MTDQNTSPNCEKRPCHCPVWIGWLFLLIVAGGVFGLGLLVASVMEHRAEALKRSALFEIAPKEMDAEQWGRNYPRQYDSWHATQEMSFTSKYGGNTRRDYLEETPANAILFAGYGFSKEYLQARGHWYTLEDVTHTKRVNEKTPASCWYCKSPDVPRLIGEWGVEKFASHTFDELKGQITHAISCYDCHEENTMKLRVLRPAIIEGFAKQGKSINSFTHQEMRSIACAQCHSTYYFENDTNIVTFPWAKGLSVENIEQYYKEDGFSDWTHPISKTRMIKVRHPDYELFSTGVHAFQGLSCADCHMPYRTEGAEKFSDHHLQSPLANISRSCAVCHRWSEEEVRERVTSIQDKVREGRNRAEFAIAHAHFDIAAAAEAGATDEELAEARDLLRYAQMHWDFIAAANAMGFHSPQEAQRILATALDKASQVRLMCSRILARHGYTDEVVYPDFSTKEKAQELSRQFTAGTPPSLLKKQEPGDK
ncbi:MAG: ammonia-forming cytochrome c nitrite reductase subunit c552 [Planctomycetaceae bacterium]|nr:ammonia-forming cytochrome c nitrite reductase subunit c552 [Planctomycetaceae bacterium]